MSESHILPTESVNFKTYRKESSMLRYLKVPLNNRPNGSVSLSAASSEQLEFKLPAVPYNLSKSIIGYSSVVAAGGAGNSNWLFNNSGLELAQSLTFASASGQTLADLQYVNNYLAFTRPIQTTENDYRYTDYSAGMNPAYDKTTNYTGLTITPPAGNIYGLAASATTTALTAGEPQYLRRNLALNAALELSRSFMLGNVKGTIFEPNKVQFFGQEMYLRIQTAPSSKVGFLSTSITDPTAGAAVLATQPTVSAYLYLAVETNEVICASLKEKYMQGKLEYLVPYTTVIRNSTSGSGRQSINVQVTSQYGRVLKRVIHSVFPASETLNAAYDHNNFNGSKITAYQTAIDSFPQQNDFLNCLQPSDANPTLQLDDYRENMRYLNGSVIQNSAAYQFNWVHCDNFVEPEHGDVPDSNILAGLDVSIPKQWQITMDLTNSNYAHYTALQFARMLSITPASGPVFIS